MLIALCLGALAIGAPFAVRQALKTARVQVSEGQFIIPEAKASFTVPSKWVTNGHFILDTTQLKVIQKVSKVEWVSAYGPIVDSVLPFEDCLLYITSYDWVGGGGGAGDLQMRAYLTGDQPDEITKAVAAKGVGTAHLVKGRSVDSESRDEDGWRIDHVEFYLWYGDYGGRAGVYFYSRRSGSETLVLVFMHIENRSAIDKKDSILKSFKMQK